MLWGTLPKSHGSDCHMICKVSSACEPPGGRPHSRPRLSAEDSAHVRAVTMRLQRLLRQRLTVVEALLKDAATNREQSQVSQDYRRHMDGLHG